MSFRPSLALLSKASRAPLTSKHANKEFYKGTGSFPGLGPKRQGRHGSKTNSKAPYILMPSRMRTFVVPEGLNQSSMLPYVSTEVKISDAPSDWPRAWSKGEEETKKGGLFGPNGFDGAYYLQLAEWKKEQTRS